MAPRPKIYDASDPEQIASAQRLDEDKIQDLLDVAGSQRGRRWLYSLVFERCHFERPTQGSEFNEGARAVGMEIMNELRQLSPQLYMKMLEEHHFPDA